MLHIILNVNYDYFFHYIFNICFTLIRVFRDFIRIVVTCHHLFPRPFHPVFFAVNALSHHVTSMYIFVFRHSFSIVFDTAYTLVFFYHVSSISLHFIFRFLY